MISFVCDYCGGEGQDYPSHYKRKKLHFCKQSCYGRYICEIKKPDEQNAWQGGISHAESNRRWREKNRAKVNAAARARRLREMDTPGTHTKEDWERIKKQFNNTCAEHDETCKGYITKDHIIPIGFPGSSNNPDNLQPLCRSHNARKRRRVYTGRYGEE